jgi:hypothetical protein
MKEIIKHGSGWPWFTQTRATGIVCTALLIAIYMFNEGAALQPASQTADCLATLQISRTFVQPFKRNYRCNQFLLDILPEIKYIMRSGKNARYEHRKTGMKIG